MDPHEQSDRDFSRARRRAFLRRIGAYLRRDPGSNQLLSFDEVKGALGAISQVYLGMREVPVSKIVGSVELHSRVPVDSALTARDLLHKLEHRQLLQRLPIDRVLPEIEVEFSDVADYRRLATHIEAHGFRVSQLWKRYVSPEEVLRDWYEYGYCPIAEMIREEHILDAFPDRTELDLYLWIAYHRERLALEARDEEISPQAAKDDILKNVPRRRRRSSP